MSKAMVWARSLGVPGPAKRRHPVPSRRGGLLNELVKQRNLRSVAPHQSKQSALNVRPDEVGAGAGQTADERAALLGRSEAAEGARLELHAELAGGVALHRVEPREGAAAGGAAAEAPATMRRAHLLREIAQGVELYEVGESEVDPEVTTREYEVVEGEEQGVKTPILSPISPTESPISPT